VVQATKELFYLQIY